MLDVARRHPRRVEPDVGRRHRQQERIPEQLQGLEVGLVDRQGQHHGIELAACELIEQHARLGLAQLDLQIGIAALEHRQHPRQHIGRQRRDDAQGQATGQDVAAMPGEIEEIARRGQDLLAALGDLDPDIGQHHVAWAALDHLDAELPLQVADLHGQRRLGHRAGIGGPAEMPMLGQRGEISELFQRDHIDKINLSEGSGNTIRPDL